MPVKAKCMLPPVVSVNVCLLVRVSQDYTTVLVLHTTTFHSGVIVDNQVGCCVSHTALSL